MDLGNLRLSVASAEDVLISKLEWAKRGDSERQLMDAAGILRLQGAQLDFEYIEAMGSLARAAAAMAVRTRSGGATVTIRW